MKFRQAERPEIESEANRSPDRIQRQGTESQEGSIHLPKTHLEGEQGYYGTGLHEVDRWTGHPLGLNRSVLTGSDQSGDFNYAR